MGLMNSPRKKLSASTVIAPKISRMARWVEALCSCDDPRPWAAYRQNTQSEAVNAVGGSIEPSR